MCITKWPEHRIVEMFHAGTPQSVKSHIIGQMALSGSHLRVLICTVVFRMVVVCLANVDQNHVEAGWSLATQR